MSAMTSAAPDRNRRSRRREALRGWSYAAPTALFVLFVFLVPLGLVVQMSGSDWPLLGGNQGWNLPENFTDAVSHRLFWDSIWFTLKYTIVTTVLLIGLGLGLALLVQESTRWKSLLRTAFLVPSALGLASASLLFYVLYSPFAGPFADLMQAWGFTFLGSPDGALWSTVFLIVWRFAGFYMLLMLVGLQGIPDDVYEAARIDGASRWQTFRDITMPLLRPTFALTTVLCVTGSLLAFEQFYILTKGGPDNSTMTIVQLIYNVAFQGQNDLGVAGALSVIVLLALIVINVVQLRVLRRPEESYVALQTRSATELIRVEERHTRVGRSPAMRMVLGIPYWLFTTALAIIFLYPLIWTAVASVQGRAGTSQPDGWGFGNYAALADYQAGVWVYLGNSLFVSLLTVLLTLTVSTLGGYAFARFRFPGKNLLFLTTLAILMVPYATLLIPLYVILNAVGLSNSLVGVAIVLTMFQLPFSMFMMRISFESIPRELDEAAMVDGCSTWSALWRVLLPAVKPGLVTVGLFAFLAAWNDFFAPLILITDTNRMTLPLAVANLRVQVQGVIDYGATEAGVVVLALPCIVLFLVLQRHYVRGFMSGAFKG